MKRIILATLVAAAWAATAKNIMWTGTASTTWDTTTANWTVPSAAGAYGVVLSGKTFKAGFATGTTIIFR